MERMVRTMKRWKKFLKLINLAFAIVILTGIFNHNYLNAMAEDISGEDGFTATKNYLINNGHANEENNGYYVGALNEERTEVTMIWYNSSENSLVFMYTSIEDSVVYNCSFNIYETSITEGKVLASFSYENSNGTAGNFYTVLYMAIYKPESPLFFFSDDYIKGTTEENEGLDWSEKGREEFQTAFSKWQVLMEQVVKVPFKELGFISLPEDISEQEKISVTGVTVKQTQAYLKSSADYLDMGTDFVTVLPENAANKEYDITSSDSSVAYVGEDNKVYPRKNGTAVITVTTKDGGYTAECTVVVELEEEKQEPEKPEPEKPEKIPVTGVTVKQTQVYLRSLTDYLDMGTDFVTVFPNNATNKEYSVTSSDSSIAYVGGDNKVYPRKDGTALITVTTENGYIAECIVIVELGGEKTKEKSVIHAKSLKKSYGSGTFYLGATADGDGKLSYASSNKKVAVISSTGEVTLKSFGKTTITIKAAETENYTSASKKITLTVSPAKAKINKLFSKEKKSMSVNWNPVKGNVNYQVQISLNKSFNKHTIQRSIKKNKAGVSLLQSGKTYYVRVRAYGKKGSKKYFGSWSSIRSVKIK